MIPIALYVHDKSEVIAYACGKCRFVKRDHAEALDCCEPRKCECGALIAEQYYTACAACRAREDARRLRERLLAAERVSEADAEWLMCECHDQFEPNAEELFDWHEGRAADLPSYAWACTKIVLTLDARDVVSNALCDDFHEDAFDTVGDEELATLQKAMNDFCETANVTSYHADYKRVVPLDEARAERLKETAADGEATE